LRYSMYADLSFLKKYVAIPPSAEATTDEGIRLRENAFLSRRSVAVTVFDSGAGAP
jgi:hypothetical protein